jgi:hypothetical protein
MPSKGPTCIGVIRTIQKCKLSRAIPGNSICIKGPCGKCGEQRCRTHCLCGRQGTAKGRKKARPRTLATRRGVSVAAEPAEPAAHPLLLPARGRPANVGAEVLSDGVWMPRVLADVRDAHSVVASSLCVDHPQFCALLKRRLANGATVTIMVDRQYFSARSAPRQRPRLLELQEAGAAVYLCQGCGGRYGRFHKKAVVVDSRIAYVGGANLTDQAVNYNGELVVRLLGPPVAETLTELEQCLSKPSTARGIA